MEYLSQVLGIKATVQRAEFDHLPNYIAVRYRLQKVSMDGQKVIFLYPKTELEQIEVLKKHIARIQKNENLPAKGNIIICCLCSEIKSDSIPPSSAW